MSEEHTLDPQDWTAFRALGHHMLDDMFDYMQNVRDRDVWQPVPEEVKSYLQQPIPEDGREEEAVYGEFVQKILPHTMGNVHPRFWGWVMGNGTPLGVLAEMLAATMNPNMGGGDHVGYYVERQVLDWYKALMGFPHESSGLLTSGGSMANLVGLTVARNAKAQFDIRANGLTGAPHRMMIYASEQTHNSVQKTVELLGLGYESLRSIPVNDDYQIEVAALWDAIQEDRAAGHVPFCVVGSAGTTATGAIDNLNALADICQNENLWFHVDGAFGAMVILAPELRPLVAGIERADSLAFDLHKWIYLPFDVGCALVRHRLEHFQAFSLIPDFLTHAERGLAAGPEWYSDYGVELTRSFRALKVWMSMQVHGAEKYGSLILQDVRHARYLKKLVVEHPQLELTAPVPLNIVCFRYVEAGLSEDQLNALNTELLLQLQESGVAIVTNATLKGKYSLRASNTNHRTRQEDLHILVDEVVKIGQQLLNGG
jgi:glutamate/tyrosine decarboxylase-like PLP-dependent enzyme